MDRCTVQNQTFTTILTLDELLDQTQLGTKKFPNAAKEYDLSDVQEHLPIAIEESTRYIQKLRDEYVDEMDTKILEYLEELDRLKERHLGQMELDFNQESKRLEKQKEIETIFENYHRWITESMEIEKQPFIQVIAVLKGSAS
jgi:hypothetical protein